jgi:hypothetical protein
MEPLSDPLGDRPIPSVQAPPHKPLDPKIMYPNPGKNHFQAFRKRNLIWIDLIIEPF